MCLQIDKNSKYGCVNGVWGYPTAQHPAIRISKDENLLHGHMITIFPSSWISLRDQRITESQRSTVTSIFSAKTYAFFQF